jgi:hypothetical protein
LPVVHRLEEKYGDELVVVGVHAGKFIAERETENIRVATQRLGITHPIVNDRHFRTWRAYGVQAWPTVVLVSPDGQYIGQHSGEFTFDQFDRIIGMMAEAYRQEGLLTGAPLPHLLPSFGQDRHPPSPPFLRSELVLSGAKEPLPLRFPGKVLADPLGGRLFISDTGNNRVLVARVESGGAAVTVEAVIGSGEAGFRDGTFGESQLNRPEGLALQEETLYIADTENHSIRAANLSDGTLATVAGTGEIGYSRAGGMGREVSLNSPWDLLESDNYLYIAMAGTHQIWRMVLSTGRVEPFAGNGRENIDDGPNRSATLAQPCGLSTDEQRLYFADSESSAIRASDFSPDGYTQTLIGRGLFDFGDKDGSALESKLQHCLGVAYHEGALYIADTYNNKIKCLDLTSKQVATALGSGSPTEMYEPGGLSVWDDGVQVPSHRSGQALTERSNEAGARLYIADTNLHRVLQSAIDAEGNLQPPLPVSITFAPNTAGPPTDEASG